MSTEDIKKQPIDPMIFDEGSVHAEPKKKPERPMIFEAPKKSIEDKTYIVMVKSEDDDSDFFDGKYKICHGRTECYRYIESLLEAFDDEIDIYASMIITETRQTETETGDIKYYLINLPECVSIYAFCKSVQEYYGKYGFDIEKYANHTIMTADSEEKHVATNDELANILLSVRNSMTKPVDPMVFERSPKPIESPLKKEFPDLFKDDGDGSVNV